MTTVFVSPSLPSTEHIEPPSSLGDADGALQALVAEISTCRVCAVAPRGKPLPHAPRPVLRPSTTARICIVGQAPGTRVHASGTPFTDPSGDRLRAWLGVDSETFYDTRRIAIVPMGFCFPGLDAAGSDLPPRPECPPLWQARVFAAMPQVALIVAVGGYAQRFHIGRTATNVTSTVADWRAILARPVRPQVFPLPHPSWRNSGWLKRHPWFETELLPDLRTTVARLLADT